MSATSRRNQGSRSGSGRNRHPDTKRSYILRSFITCDMCGHRMHGKSRHDVPYFACEPDPNEHRDRPWFATHPKSLWVREEVLLKAISGFFATHVFGPDRRALLRTALEAAPGADDSGARLAKERDDLTHAIAAIEQRQARLIRTLAESGGGDGSAFDEEQEQQFRNAVRQEHATLGRQRKPLAEQLARLDEPVPAADTTNEALLDALPHLNVNLTHVPEEVQRRLYAAFSLEVRYSRPRKELALRVTIPGHMIDGLVAVTRELDPWHKKSGARTEVRTPDLDTCHMRTGQKNPIPFPSFKCPRQDSNLRTRLRRPMLYPLSYGGVSLCCSATGETLPASARCP